MSLLINTLTVGKKDEFTLAELKDTVIARLRYKICIFLLVLPKIKTPFI